MYILFGDFLNLTQFLLYLCISANSLALRNKRKTLTANDVFSALEDMEFDNFVPELKICLEGRL